MKNENPVYDISVVIQGPLEKVFDIVCVAGLWPQWHPVTRAVGGVTEIPFQKGDKIYEFIRTPEGPYEFHWKIVEFNRPHRCEMVAQDGSAITYTFEKRADGILFRRVAKPGPEASNMSNWSEESAGAYNTEPTAVANLKALVEKIIWRQEKGPKLEPTKGSPQKAPDERVPALAK
jgi:hypothetical protein